MALSTGLHYGITCATIHFSMAEPSHGWGFSQTEQEVCLCGLHSNFLHIQRRSIGYRAHHKESNRRAPSSENFMKIAGMDSLTRGSCPYFGLFQNYSCIHLIDDIPGLHYFEFTELRRLFLVTIIVAFFVAVVSCLFIYLTFRSLHNPDISQKTIEMQRRFQNSLILQVRLSTMFFFFFRCFCCVLMWISIVLHLLHTCDFI